MLRAGFENVHESILNTVRTTPQASPHGSRQGSPYIAKQQLQAVQSPMRQPQMTHSPYPVHAVVSPYHNAAHMSPNHHPQPMYVMSPMRPPPAATHIQRQHVYQSPQGHISHQARTPQGHIAHHGRTAHGHVHHAPSPSRSPYAHPPIYQGPVSLPQQYIPSPAHGHQRFSPAVGGRKRGRSVSSSPSESTSSSDESLSSEPVSESEYSYSASESEQSDASPSMKARRIDYGDDSRRVLSKPPSPPKYYSRKEEEEFAEDLDSSDSDYEEEEKVVDKRDVADLRRFIDFDPKYNKTRISKTTTTSSGSRDPLKSFLFDEPAQPRRWFKTFTQTAVGAKLAKQAAATPKR